MRSIALPRTPRSVAGRLLLTVLAVLALAFTVLVAAPQPSAEAHGWIVSPASRQDLCYTGAVSNCGPVQYEPWSVEAPKGSTQCSGGGRFRELDNESIAWPRQAVSTNQTFTWDIVANHATSTWEYFVDGRLHTTINDGGKLPPDTVTHQISNLPTGNHKIFVRWNIADTVNAFYACIDAYITPGGAPAPTTAPPTTTPPPTGGSGSCTAALTVANSWSGGYQASVTVTAGSSGVDGWTTTLPSGVSITQVWNGSANGNTVSDVGWNGKLGAGQSTTYGFIANGSPPSSAVSCSS
ncbi:lytic polysaccharide monooxygenase [Myceligenerans crystallogenes]|uniref:CBM2 domain-containing protein n=1 Tax=Myceligenerans crystallogenes TaxID=316335 RepID=A0ABP4ZWC6_9MICO